MELKWKDGGLALGPGGIPETVSGLEELLQKVWMRLALRRGSFPYGRELGSGLADWDAGEEHSRERAEALANEALLDLPGVRAETARILENGVAFTVSTPLGEGEVTLGTL